MVTAQQLRAAVARSPRAFRWIARSAPYAAYQRCQLRSWERSGRSIPGPAVFKQSVVREYGERFGIKQLVETGTYLGQLATAMRHDFDRIVTIELDDALFARATKIFEADKHIEVMHGDSSKVLPALVSGVTQPCLFWLDAHYSGPGTAKGLLDTPIGRELDAVLSSGLEHVILIDDAREFGTARDYPALATIEALIRARRPGWVVEVRDDIVRAHRSRS